MRMFVYVEPSATVFNALVKKGTAGDTMKKILKELKPEATYFIENNGRRAFILIMDVADTSHIPKSAEPWFLKFDAKVEFHPCMTPEDLGKAGLDALGKKWG